MMPSGKSTTWASGTPVVSGDALIASILFPEIRMAPFSTGAPSTVTTRLPFTIHVPVASAWSCAKQKDAMRIGTARTRVALRPPTSVCLQRHGLAPDPDLRRPGPRRERGSVTQEESRGLAGLD